MAKNAALGLEFDLSKINRQMDLVGSRLEDSLGGAVKAVDKKLGKLGKGSHLKHAGTSAAQVYGTSFADTFLAVFAGAFIANGGISKILAPDILKLPRVVSGMLRTVSKGLKLPASFQKTLQKDLQLLLKNSSGQGFQFDPDSVDRLAKQETLLKRLGTSTAAWRFQIAKLGVQSKVFGLVAKGADGARAFIVRGTRGLQLFARTAAAAGASALAAFKVVGVALAAVVAALGIIGKLMWEFGKAAYDSFKRTDTAARSLQKTLNNLARSQGVSSKAARAALGEFRAQAEGLSKTAGIGQGDTLNAANFLSRSGFNKGQTQELLNISANIAADPANGVNSITDAAELLSDALNGSAGAAERLGIFIKEGDGSAADFANRMKQLQTQLKGNFGGAAQAVSPFVLLAETVERIKATIGEYVAPAIEDIVNEVNALLASFSKEDLAGIGIFLADSFRTAWEFLKGIWGVVSDIFTFIGAQIDVVKAEFNFIVTLKDNIIEAIFELDALLHRLLMEFLAAVFAGIEEVLGPKLSKAIGVSKLSDSLKAELSKGIKPEDWDALRKINDAGKNVLGKEAAALNAGLNIFKPDTGGIEARIAQGKQSLAAATGLLPKTQNLDLSGSKWVAEQQLRIKEEKDKALEELSKRAEQYADANSGAQLSINIKNVRPDRFRKVRSR